MSVTSPVKAGLIAMCAVSGAAVRQKTVADGSTGLLQVMETINSLMTHKGKASEVAASSVTPGVETSLNEALAKAIEEISAKVDAPIKSAHASSQAAIDAAFQNFKQDAATVLTQKEEADQADHEHYECVDEEKGLLLTAEAADEAHEGAKEARVEPCALQVERTPFEKTIASEPFNFDCDLSLDGICDVSLTSLKEHSQEQKNELLASTTRGQELYDEAKLACDAAHADVAAKKAAHEHAVAAWTSQRAKCAKLAATRSSSLCSFGTAMQGKCTTQLPQYEAIVAKVKAAGNEHSDPDRVQEWTSSHITKCLMQSVAEGQDVDAAVAGKCAASVDFASHVGTINYHEADVAALLIPSKFTCAAAQEISFKGTTWSVPAKDGLVSGDYTTVPFTPTLALEAGSAPFEFC